MTVVYVFVGAVVVWSAVAVLATTAAFIAFCYLCAAYRMWRICVLAWSDGESAWPRLETRLQKLKAFFRVSWLLMVEKIDAVAENGEEIPRWPWQPMPSRD